VIVAVFEITSFPLHSAADISELRRMCVAEVALDDDARWTPVAETPGAVAANATLCLSGEI